MDIIFIHGNYPAQFRHLAASIGQSGDHRVIFITNRELKDCQPIKGVTIRKFDLHRAPSKETHHYLSATEEAILKGQSVLRSINLLIEEGLKPELIISHGGMGLGIFIKELLPNAIHIGLFEWFFTNKTSHFLLRDFSLNEQLQTNMRNLPILEELRSCDVGVVPTAWQKKQFPTEYQQKLNVIFDGIDTNFFKPDNSIDEREVILNGEETTEPLIIKTNTPIMSYATRGMETLRGFPEFMSAAAEALNKIEDLHVVIAGKDRRAYSYDSLTHSGSWKNSLLAELGDFKGRSRMHFTGLMDYKNYLLLLQRSNLHCYFTRPYVTSWSLFEAAACGTRLCVNHTEATDNIVNDEKTVLWVDLDKPKELTKNIVSTLKDSRNIERSTMHSRYSLSINLKQWENLINQCIQQRK